MKRGFLIGSLLLLVPIARGQNTLPLSRLDLKLVEEFVFFNSTSPQAGRSAGGNAIRIAGREFPDGIGIRGSSRWELHLDGHAQRFHGWVGMTDDSKEPGPVWFEIIGDDRVLYAGKPLKPGDAAEEVSVALDGVRTLVLVAESPDWIQPYAAWADASIAYSGAPPAAAARVVEKAYILTPPVSPIPRLNGAKTFGVRPGHPILFRVAATGQAPLAFEAGLLPPGVTFDPATGQFGGVLVQAGDYPITVTVKNGQGSDEAEIHLVAGSTLALTPPMGWNSWNCFALDVSATDIRSAADAMVASGLREHGWSYINIDDFWATRPLPSDPVWQNLKTRAVAKKIRPPEVPEPKEPSLIGPARDSEGRINPNSRFPDMTGLVSYIHRQGMKAGIYSSPGPLTCGQCTASYGHEAQDARRWADWGFDYLKYDWCSYHFYAPDESKPELIRPYATMGEALAAQNRDIVFSLCQYGMGEVWTWGATAGGNSWRTTTDILDTWASMSGNGFSQNGHERFAGPGRWNDPDMLVVGKVGWGRNLHPSNLSPEEQYTHVSLWCLQASPLLIGCDLTQLDDFTRGLLTNDEVLAIDQDSLGRPAGRVIRQRGLEVWSRPLEDGSIAVGLFNRGELPAMVAAPWKQLGLTGPHLVRDLWRQKDLGVFSASFSGQVPRHGVLLLKISALSPELSVAHDEKALPARSAFVHPDTAPDGSWHADWIGVKEPAQRNQWTSFTRSFPLEKKPARALARIATDTKYWLWVNGRLAVREGGLKRGPTPTDSYFDQIDLAPFLHGGANSVAVLVWHLGLDGFSHNDSGQSGLLFEMQGEQGEQSLLLSDGKWRARLNPAFGDTDGPFPNYRLSESNIRFTAERELASWTQPGFDGTDWPAAVDFGPAPRGPWNRLVARPVPFWEESTLRDYVNEAELPAKSDGGVVVGKLPYNAQVTPYLKIAAAPGLLIDIRTDDYLGGTAANVRAEYVTRGGEQEFECYGWMNGSAVQYRIPAGVKILRLGYRESGYATTFQGGFRADDPQLNRLREKAARTLYLTMRDTYMDCPDRERSQWWGDVVNELGEVAYALDRQADRLTRKAILELVGWQKQDGALFAPIPAGNWRSDLPAQMLASVGEKGFWTYGLYSGDVGTLAVAYPGVKRYLQIWDLGPDGLVQARPGAWPWGDWGNDLDMPVLINAWYDLALQGLRHMALATGHPEDVRWIDARRKTLAQGFASQFWTGTEYRSSSYRGATDDRANALAVIAGLVPPDRYDALRRVFSAQQHASPYMEKYVLEALCEMNHAEDAQARMKVRFGPMIADPDHSTLWEGWGIGRQGYGGGTVNHAWSGGPLTIMSQYFAGIAPTRPAFVEYDVFPQPGALHHIDATVASPRGKIVESLVVGPYSLQLKLTSPPGTVGTVGLPAPAGQDIAEVRINGTVVWARHHAAGSLTGIQVIGYGEKYGRYLQFKVMPGQWNFAVTSQPTIE